jgi:cell division protein FtsB
MRNKSKLQVLTIISKKWMNKFIFTLLIFLTWIVFFDKYNFFAQIRLKRSTLKLEQEYEKIKQDIIVIKNEKEELDSNKEKYGREKYYLHKDNEEVFIIDKK